MTLRNRFGLALVSLALIIPRQAAAQGRTFKGDHFEITFQTSGWDTVKSSSNIIAKYGGFYGMGTLGAAPGTDLPDVDSLTGAFSETWGGKIAKDSSGVKTLGEYQVHWQKCTYDSLPKLSALIPTLISGTSPFPVSLQKGSFRVYCLAANGFTFTITCMSVLPGVIAPYAEVERAIETLKLGMPSAILHAAPGGRSDLWIRDGKLGGPWHLSNRPVSVEGYDARGRVRMAAGVSLRFFVPR